MYCIKMNCDIKAIQGTKNLTSKWDEIPHIYLNWLIVELPNSTDREIFIKSILTCFIAPDKNTVQKHDLADIILQFINVKAIKMSNFM